MVLALQVEALRHAPHRPPLRRLSPGLLPSLRLTHLGSRRSCALRSRSPPLQPSGLAWDLRAPSRVTRSRTARARPQRVESAAKQSSASGDPGRGTACLDTRTRYTRARFAARLRSRGTPRGRFASRAAWTSSSRLIRTRSRRSDSAWIARRRRRIMRAQFPPLRVDFVLPGDPPARAMCAAWRRRDVLVSRPRKDRSATRLATRRNENSLAKPGRTVRGFSRRTASAGRHQQARGTRPRRWAHLRLGGASCPQRTPT